MSVDVALANLGCLFMLHEILENGGVVFPRSGRDMLQVGLAVGLQDGLYRICLILGEVSFYKLRNCFVRGV